MKRTLTMVFLMLIASSVESILITIAQTPAPPPPPKVLRIAREEVKPYMDIAHAKVEVGWPKAWAKANRPYYWLAMTTLSGPAEAWFLNGYKSFADIEKDDKEFEKLPALKAETARLGQLDKEMLRGSRGIMATFREDLSYHAEVNMANMRYFRVNTIRVRPGLNDEFIEYRKNIKAANEKLQSDSHYAIYQTVSGAPNGTFLIFTPMKSMAEMDPNPVRDKAFQDALGDENRKRLSELASKAIISNEPIHFAFSPEMSYVSKDFAASDKAYWSPRPKPVAKSPEPAKKPADKTGAGQ